MKSCTIVGTVVRSPHAPSDADCKLSLRTCMNVASDPTCDERLGKLTPLTPEATGQTPSRPTGKGITFFTLLSSFAVGPSATNLSASLCTRCPSLSRSVVGRPLAYSRNAVGCLSRTRRGLSQVFVSVSICDNAWQLGIPLQTVL